MSNLIAHAKRELEAIGLGKDCEDEIDQLSRKWVLDLVTTFAKQDHSLSSAMWTISAVGNLLKFKPLSPLTGEDSEWVEVVDGELWQNIRASNVFKNAEGTAWDIDGKVFIDQHGDSFTNKDSHVTVTFPYTPTTEYVNIEVDDEED